MSVSKRLAYNALESSGFCYLNFLELFVVRAAEFSVAYAPRLHRKYGKLRYGGGVGLYFNEFEIHWRDFLSEDEIRMDFTLPMIISIDNFSSLIDGMMFNYSDDFDHISSNACQIYDLCSKGPSSVEEFAQTLILDDLLGKRISEYVHVFSFYENSNLYLRKSVCFIRWFAVKWPQYADHLYRRLTPSQIQRLG